MTTFTEGQHEGEFIVEEFGDHNFCREVATVKSGENLVDGQLVQLDGANLVAKDAILNTAGEFETAVEGIVIGNHDATDAAIDDVVYFKRGPLVVDGASLTYPTDVEDEADAALLALNIVVR